VSGNQKMYVFAIVNDEDPSKKIMDKNTLIQISESIQLIVSMRNYSDLSLSSNQLVNAIMNNDSYRTTQIAKKSDVNIKAIHDMWILIIPYIAEDARTELLTTNRLLQVKEFLSYRFKSSFVGSYEESIICLMGESPDDDVMESAPYEFMNEIYFDDDLLLLCFSNLQTLTDVRKAYDASQEGWFTLKTIYKTRSVFFQQDLNFALLCSRITKQEGNPAKEHQAILEPLLTGSPATESLETLSVFLLDAGGSITETAKLMHIHPNTVKYRLKEIKKKLKVDLVKLPDAYELYLAASLYRLSNEM
jgi:sugar diacid utilization regulator